MMSEMRPRERILAAIARKPVDKVPTDYWGTAKTTAILLKALKVPDEISLWKALGVDKIIDILPDYIGPPLKSGNGHFTNYWGVDFVVTEAAGGAEEYNEIACSPLADYETIDEIEANYTWPSADWFDYSNIAEKCAAYPDYAIYCGHMAPFYWYFKIRGIEQTLFDLAADEQLAEYIIGRITGFLLEHNRRIFEAGNGRIDVAHVTDDFGTQRGLMISLDMFRKYFSAPFRRCVKLVKDYGIHVMHHDDGAIMELIPDLVELGIDVLNPIQWHLPGMDLSELKSRFGGKICFHGGIDNQYMLPFGSREEIEQEVGTCIEKLSSDGTGYIVSPCNYLQAITPVENIVAMYETANRFRF